MLFTKGIALFTGSALRLARDSFDIVLNDRLPTKRSLLMMLPQMVANSGIPGANTALITTVEDWERMLIVNAHRDFLCYKHAAEQMIFRGHHSRITGANFIAGKIGDYLWFPSYSLFDGGAIRNCTPVAT
ncbi:uncharacterized protein EDB93DRAFT_1106754 [Suillus bovinus]|uniref:uncharacterized protein n=1 Tax=Suillus bovinus TaxID=48563 RepID=UPI001B865CF3|nr:uncharacterized protein EDB93DRAFT_1106754 [Suillus bovinus]KAG2136964.1 hypothetical protein EDB93DRAFT_1106754 [Suillus bovinus]